ncbi:alpha/beta hydrolase, partial [Actinoplanes philippinensis]|uniref:alpha/beta hydrolase n=1 Tax=Actinoplanes philippinensis TaxID=35752 RepID=UPI00348403FB
PVTASTASSTTTAAAAAAGTVPALFGGRLTFSGRQLFGPDLPAEEAAAHLERIGARPRAELFSRDTLPEPVGGPPTLVVGSPDDRVVPRQALDRAAARYGGAPLLFPGMGHYLMLEASWAEPIDAILDWLDKELPPAG